MDGPRVLVAEHPVVAHRVSVLRDETTDSAAFRRVLGEVAAHVAYVALGDLETGTRTIDTPVEARVSVPVVTETVLLVPVLRAGLGMVPAIQALLPASEVAHIGLRRDEDTLVATLYLDALPKDLSGRRVVVCDPMLATGGTLIEVCDIVKSRRAASVLACCIIAAAPGLVAFHAVHPDVTVATAAIDPELNDRGYIVPGLGDAGDRLFGPPPA